MDTVQQTKWEIRGRRLVMLRLPLIVAAALTGILLLTAPIAKLTAKPTAPTEIALTNVDENRDVSAAETGSSSDLTVSPIESADSSSSVEPDAGQSGTNLANDAQPLNDNDRDTGTPDDDGDIQTVAVGELETNAADQEIKIADAGGGEANQGSNNATPSLIAPDGTGEPSSTVKPQDESQQVVLVNYHFSGGVVRYLVGDESYELEPGATQVLDASTKPVITFHRGGEFGTARFECLPGRYVFTVAERGWDLISY